jgi:DNA-binding transcriptional regulator GbsR (MarR family)
MFRIVSQERKRREIDPTLKVIAECVEELKNGARGDAGTRERLENMLDFLKTTTGLFEEFLRIPTPALKGLGKLSGRLSTLLPGKKS